MDTETIKKAIVVNVYHIPESEKVPLHKHPKSDEVFYCVKGTGFGVLEDREVELAAGQAFIVSAGRMHSLRAVGDLYVVSILIPKSEEV